MCIVDLNIQCKSCRVKVYLEQNEDYRPGDSTSESVENPLQRGVCVSGRGGAVSIDVI